MDSAAVSPPRGPAREIFGVALRLGLSSFGGPIAHLAYFERTYVRQLGWLNADEYGRLVSLCQLLPGPTSSQVGFLIGLQRGGLAGALAAWLGFTLPSAALMFGFAVLAASVTGQWIAPVLHGLMLTAVVVVAQAVLNMWRQLCPDTTRRLIAVGVATLVLLLPGPLAQFSALLAGALAGAAACKNVPSALPTVPAAQYPFRSAKVALTCFAALLIGLPLAGAIAPNKVVTLSGIFYRSGALVFGGGHVVLPLLQNSLVGNGWITNEAFLSGYGFAQVVPGPLFTIAAFLGAAAAPMPQRTLWAACSLVAIFLPGLLLALAAQPLWDRAARASRLRGAVAGVNSAVVGILGAALWSPVITTAIGGLPDVVLACGGFILLQWKRIPVLAVAAACIAVSLFLEALV